MRFLVVTKRISRRDHEEAFGRGVGKNFHSPKDSSWWPKESHGETVRFLVVTKRISRRDHEEAFGGGVGKNFDSPKDFSWWPKESHGETARFLMVTKTSRWDHEEPLVVGSRSNWAFTKRKSLYLTVRISWSPRGIHGPRGHCMTFMPKSQNCSIFVSKPWNYFPIIRAQTKFNFGGSKADICQTSNLQNGLFFASSNKAFKSLEILKLIKNWILSFRAIYQNVQASVKFWYQIQIIRYFIAAEISHYLITVFYDHPVLMCKERDYFQTSKAPTQLGCSQ